MAKKLLLSLLLMTTFVMTAFACDHDKTVSACKLTEVSVSVPFLATDPPVLELNYIDLVLLEYQRSASTFDFRSWTFDEFANDKDIGKFRRRYSTLDVRHSTLDVRHSTLDVRHSTLDVRHSTLNLRPNSRLLTKSRINLPFIPG